MNAIRMPAVFIGHGSPSNVLENNEFTAAWRDFAASIPRPKAILSISAHWYTRVTAVTAMARPPTIHDFGGFPPEMYQLRYPAPGSPELANEVAKLLAPDEVYLDHDQWGLDHGTWAVLMHMYPEADIPVVQLSLNGRASNEHHYELAQRLAPLREQGVLVFASGQIVHNLRMTNFSMGKSAYDWALRFEEAVTKTMTTDPASVLSLFDHPDYAQASPTPEHFLPLVYLAALAEDKPAQALLRDCSLGSSSLSSYSVGTNDM
ncbi:MAG: 4,5-DOPA dioxygenase extradiol [Burkholderiales bacterium]